MTAHLISLNGRPFRCHCTANVFVDAPPYEGYEVFKCNACGTEYMSERKAPTWEPEYQI